MTTLLTVLFHFEKRVQIRNKSSERYQNLITLNYLQTFQYPCVLFITQETRVQEVEGNLGLNNLTDTLIF